MFKLNKKLKKFKLWTLNPNLLASTLITRNTIELLGREGVNEIINRFLGDLINYVKEEHDINISL